MIPFEESSPDAPLVIHQGQNMNMEQILQEGTPEVKSYSRTTVKYDINSWKKSQPN